MKKKITILFLFLISVSFITLISPKIVLADCASYVNGTCDNQRPVACTGSSTTCCTTASECPSPCPNGITNCGDIGERCYANRTCRTGLICSRDTTAPIPEYFCYTIIQTPPPTAAPIDNSPTCDGDTGIQTAIGCIHALGDQSAFLNDILRWAVGIGGGIAFLLIIYAGFMTMTAAGNPERLKAGQELLTSAIAGLILLIFSVFILRFIGIDILGLDMFGF